MREVSAQSYRKTLNRMPDEVTKCGTCKGKGRVYRYWDRKFAVCVTCGGTGVVAIWKETLREFRNRLNGE